MIYFKYVKMHLKSLVGHYISFLLTTFGQLFYSVLVFFTIVFLFQRFGMVDGFSLNEVLVSYGFSFLIFSLADFIFRGFDQFYQLIVKGTFDSILTKPLPVLLQVLASDIEFSRVGRFIQAVIVLIYALIALGIHFSLMQVVALILLITCGTILLGCVFVLGAAFCFVSIQGLEIFNILTSGTRELTQYPLIIYGKEILRFFTFVFPVALVSYYPYLYIIGRSDNILYAVAPILSLLFVIPTYMLWQMGVRRYTSVGS